MTSYLLDTNILIDYSRGVPAAVEAVQTLIETGAELGLCAICVAEFFSGVQPGRYPAVDQFLRELDYWPITYDDALRAGAYRYHFARQGIQLSMTDMLIAAVAHRVGATVLTENVKDFPMDDLTAISLASL